MKARPRHTSIAPWMAVAGVAALCVAPPAGAQPRSAAGVLTGTVKDTTGAPVPYAYVYEDGGSHYAVADGAGQFRLASMPRGHVAVGVRRIGYRPARVELDLDADTAVALALTMVPLTQGLEAVRVEAGPPNYSVALDNAGFYRRVHETKVGTGTGTFIFPEDLEHRRPTMVTQILQGLPGLTIVPQIPSKPAIGGVPLGRGERCPLDLVLDGRPMKYLPDEARDQLTQRIPQTLPNGYRPPTVPEWKLAAMSLDQLVSPSTIKAIEVYPSATGVPHEFAGYAHGCGLLVIWTRRD